MAKSEGVYLIAACCCGLLSLVLNIVSYGSEAWIFADLTPASGSTDSLSQLNHGLFSGTYDRQHLGKVQTFTIKATCLMDDGVCAWSCLSTEEEREKEVQLLYESGTAPFSCKPIAATASQMTKATKAYIPDAGRFMSAALWVLTIVLLSVSLATNVIALGFNAYNIFYNPIESYASPKAIYIYYSIAASWTLSTLIIWGVHYGTYTSKNVAVLDTLNGSLNSEATLGWSYFILLPAEIGLWTAMGLVYYREYILNKKDAEQVIRADHTNNDANTFMY